MNNQESNYYCSNCNQENKKERAFCAHCGVQLKFSEEQDVLIEKIYKTAKESEIIKYFRDPFLNNEEIINDKKIKDSKEFRQPRQFTENLKDILEKGKSIDSIKSNLTGDELNKVEKQYLQYFKNYFEDIEKIGDPLSLSTSRYIQRKVAAFYNVLNDLRVIYKRYKDETHEFYRFHCKLIESIVDWEIGRRTKSDFFFQYGISAKLLNNYNEFYNTLQDNVKLLKQVSNNPIQYLNPIRPYHSIEHPHRREQSAKFLLDPQNIFDWETFEILFRQLFGKTYYLTSQENTQLNTFWNTLTETINNKISWHNFYELMPNFKIMFISPFPVNQFELIKEIKKYGNLVNIGLFLD